MGSPIPQRHAKDFGLEDYQHAFYRLTLEHDKEWPQLFSSSEA